MYKHHQGKSVIHKDVWDLWKLPATDSYAVHKIKANNQLGEFSRDFRGLRDRHIQVEHCRCTQNIELVRYWNKTHKDL